MAPIVSVIIVWVIWFLIAKKKDNTKQMIRSSEFCAFALLTVLFGAIVSIICLLLYVIIRAIVKKYKQ